MYGSQEALLSAEFAQKLYDAPSDHNEAQRAYALREKTQPQLINPVRFRPLDLKPPPVTAYAVVLSGLRLDVHLAPHPNPYRDPTPTLTRTLTEPLPEPSPEPSPEP